MASAAPTPFFDIPSLPAGSVKLFMGNPTATGLRRRVEDTVERLVAWLDALDADPDLEDDDPDHSGLDFAEFEPDRPEGKRLPLPIWGEDQSQGPVNEREVREWAFARGIGAN